MPKITGPLLSFTASGSIAKRLTFSQRNSGQQVRFQRSQKDYSNAGRATARQNYKNAVAAWIELSPTEKLEYKKKALNKRYTGFNLFVKNYILRPPITGNYLMTEIGAFLLLETGAKIIL